MGHKTLINHSGQNLIVDLITRVGGNPSNIGQTVTLTLRNGQTMRKVPYPTQFLSGIAVKVLDRGSPWDDVINTHDTFMFTGNRRVLDLSAANQGKDLVLPATAPWLDTGVDVTASDDLSITATGTWKVDHRSATIEVTADGFVGFQFPGTELATADFGSLIGRIGEDGAPFFVGSTFNQPSPSSGRLYLQMNDVVGTLGDNSGELSISINNVAERKFLINNSAQNLIIDLITREGDDPSHIGSTVTVTLRHGERKEVSYSTQLLSGVGVKVLDRGNPWDDVMNTHDTLTFTGNSAQLTISASNS